MFHVFKHSVSMYICMVFYYAPFAEGGVYCSAHLGRSVGRYVGRSVGISVYINLLQLITQEGYAQEASNLVGRESLISRSPLLIGK